MGNFSLWKQLNHVNTECVKNPKRLIQLVSQLGKLAQTKVIDKPVKQGFAQNLPYLFGS